MVAGMVAERLGWRMVGSEVVTEAARQSGFEEAKLERVFARRVSLEDRLTVNSARASTWAPSAVWSSNRPWRENVVILGRGPA